jgi:hypothetical protein
MFAFKAHEQLTSLSQFFRRKQFSAHPAVTVTETTGKKETSFTPSLLNSRTNEDMGNEST